MTTVVALLYVSTICFGGAFLFTAIENLEPDRRVALVLKCAILAAGGAAIANQLLPGRAQQPRPAMRAINVFPNEQHHADCACVLSRLAEWLI